MRIKSLEYLLDIKTTRSLSQTADNFFISRQAVNQAIKALEDELGITILQRSPKGVSFTADGEHVCQFAADILQRKEQLLLTISSPCNEQATSIKDTLAIYTIPRFDNKDFFSCYSMFCKKHAQSTLSINVLPFHHILELMPFDTPTLCLIAIHQTNFLSEQFYDILNSQQLHCEIIAKQTLGYCISQKSPWYHNLTHDVFVEYPDIPLISFNSAVSNTERYFWNNKQEYLLIDSFELQKELIRYNNFAAYCTPWEFKHFFQSMNDNFVFVPGKETSTSFLYYVILVPKTYLENRLITDFINEAKTFFTT